ncbi:putative membrane protein, partial [Plasmodium gaboni]
KDTCQVSYIHLKISVCKGYNLQGNYKKNIFHNSMYIIISEYINNKYKFQKYISYINNYNNNKLYVNHNIEKNNVMNIYKYIKNESQRDQIGVHTYGKKFIEHQNNNGHDENEDYYYDENEDYCYNDDKNYYYDDEEESVKKIFIYNDTEREILFDIFDMSEMIYIIKK